MQASEWRYFYSRDKELLVHKCNFFQKSETSADYLILTNFRKPRTNFRDFRDFKIIAKFSTREENIAQNWNTRKLIPYYISKEQKHECLELQLFTF